MPPLPTLAAPLPDPVDPTPLPSEVAPDTGPPTVDPPALPYPKEGLPALLRGVEPKLESPKTTSAEKERPLVPVKALPPESPAPELRSCAWGELKPP